MTIFLNRLHPASRCETSRRSCQVRNVLLALGLTLSVASRSLAGLVESESPWGGPRYELGDDQLQFDEVFGSHLPATLEKYALRLSVNPHLSDWQNKERMRVTTVIRYGLTSKCEISAGSNLFFSHGHGDIRAFEDYGAANLRVGAKFNLGQLFLPGWETGAGFEYDFPLGRPPAEVTDGLRHLRPYVTFSHRCTSRPNLRIFVGFRADEVTVTSVPGQFGKNAFHESSSGITGGWVLDRDRWHYTFEASYDTNRLAGQGSADIFSVRPGVLYEIPARGKSQVRSNWLVGVSVNDTYGPGGNSLGASFKLRYSSDLKNFHRHQRTQVP